MGPLCRLPPRASSPRAPGPALPSMDGTADGTRTRPDRPARRRPRSGGHLLPGPARRRAARHLRPARTRLLRPRGCAAAARPGGAERAALPAGRRPPRHRRAAASLGSRGAQRAARHLRARGRHPRPGRHGRVDGLRRRLGGQPRGPRRAAGAFLSPFVEVARPRSWTGWRPHARCGPSPAGAGRRRREEIIMTTYLISLFSPDGPPPADLDLGQVMADLEVVNADIRAAGGWVFAGGLGDQASATTIRRRRGGADAVVIDGPFAEAKEHLGGISIVRSDDY